MNIDNAEQSVAFGDSVIDWLIRNVPRGFAYLSRIVHFYRRRHTSTEGVSPCSRPSLNGTIGFMIINPRFMIRFVPEINQLALYVKRDTRCKYLNDRGRAVGGSRYLGPSGP